MSVEQTHVFEWLMGAAMSFDQWGQSGCYHHSHGYKVQLENEIFLGNLPFSARLPEECCRCKQHIQCEAWPSPSVPGGFECEACCCQMVKDMPPASDVRYAILKVNGLHRSFPSYDHFRCAVMRVACGMVQSLRAA
jgi:hypothetical protein